MATLGNIQFMSGPAQHHSSITGELRLYGLGSYKGTNYGSMGREVQIEEKRVREYIQGCSSGIYFATVIRYVM